MFRGHSRGCDVCQAVQRHCPHQPHHKGTAVRHSQRRDWPLPVLQRDGIKDAAETDSQETGESTTGQRRREKGRTVAVEHWLLSSMHRWTKGTEEAAMVASAAPLFAHGAGALHHVLHLFRERSGNHRLTQPNPNPGALVVEPCCHLTFTLKKTMKASGQVFRSLTCLLPTTQTPTIGTRPVARRVRCIDTSKKHSVEAEKSMCIKNFARVVCCSLSWWNTSLTCWNTMQHMFRYHA